MTPKQFHKICHEAILQCPQFRGYDDDTLIEGFGKFGKIPKKGWLAVISFWKEEDLLWESNYYKCLPDEVMRIFNSVDKVIDKAISDFMNTNYK